jgi:hypothetical protein
MKDNAGSGLAVRARRCIHCGKVDYMSPPGGPVECLDCAMSEAARRAIVGIVDTVPICPRCHGPAGYVHDCECEGVES